MKRHLVMIVVAVALVLAAGGAVAYAVTALQEKQPEVGGGVEPGAVDDPSSVIAEKAVDAGSGQLAVPVYREEVLVRENERCFGLGLDSGFYRNFGFRPDSFERLQALFPSDAIRRTADGRSVYVMYDTDDGGRLYVFFSGEKNGYLFEDGFPILMKETLSYKDFEGLAVGDSLGEVESIDPAAAVYKGSFDAANDLALENWTKMGAPPTSVHLLTDGIVKIEYRRDSELGYAITNIVYAADFVLEGFNGKTCYKIDEADYVQ
jgi:hypothetical protein